MTTDGNIYDVLGVGFGPSNLALAIALSEREGLDVSFPSVTFLEAQKSFAWHPDMLLDGSDMQVSFIKDLVSLRNPTSSFSFLNYLHSKNRLERFINRKSFFPSRHEFNDYFAWAAAKMDHMCTYDQRAVGVEPVKGENGQIEQLSVISENSKGEQSKRLTRDLILAIGGKPAVPDVFLPLKNIPTVVHSSKYLGRVKKQLENASGKTLKIAIIGSGQSAAEIFYDLVNDPSRPSVDLIFRSHALKPSDDSPFVNEIFNVDFTNYVYQQPKKDRRALISEYSNTNYSVVDGDLIEQIYSVFYEQDVLGGNHYNLRRGTTVTDAKPHNNKISLELSETRGEAIGAEEYDIVILATGFRRRLGETLLSGLNDYITDAEVGRSYTLETKDGFSPRIFLQGYCEETHGLSDTLLSVLAVRVDEIAEELLQKYKSPSVALSAAE